MTNWSLRVSLGTRQSLASIFHFELLQPVVLWGYRVTIGGDCGHEMESSGHPVKKGGMVMSSTPRFIYLKRYSNNYHECYYVLLLNVNGEDTRKYRNIHPASLLSL